MASTDGPGTVLDGCHDVAGHLCTQWLRVFCVPGKPVSHIADLACRSPRFEWSVNEKVAVEAAVGVSVAGGAAAVLVKHNGFAFALDSLANAALHSTGAPLVVLVGDDPDATSSTTANDSRLLAEAVGLPMLEPTLVSDTASLLSLAAEVSQGCRTPVLVRLTPQVHVACGAAPPVAAGPAVGAGARTAVGGVAHRLTKLGRVQHQRLVTLPAVHDLLRGHATQRRCAGSCDRGTITVGAARQSLPEGAGCMLSLGIAWPVPDAAAAFADDHRETWVLEDSAAHLEGHLRRRARQPGSVVGRLTGHLPPEGRLSLDVVADAMGSPRARSWVSVERKVGTAPAPPEFTSLFEAVARLRQEGTFVATDVGSSVRLCYPPYEGADVALALGSAVSVAAGAARCGAPAVAVLGDFAVLHSGINGVLDAVVHGAGVLVVVLVNGVQAQTGGQPVPPVDLPALLRACQVSRVVQWRDGDRDGEMAHRELRELLAGPLPAALLVDSRAV